jgi:hypothetical protein
MSFIKIILKYLSTRLFTLKFLDRVSQNIIWRKIIDKKKPKVTANIKSTINAESWDKSLRYKVWD